MVADTREAGTSELPPTLFGWMLLLLFVHCTELSSRMVSNRACWQEVLGELLDSLHRAFHLNVKLTLKAEKQQRSGEAFATVHLVEFTLKRC